MTAYAENTAFDATPVAMPTEVNPVLQRDLQIALETRTFRATLCPQTRPDSEVAEGVVFELCLARGARTQRLADYEDVIEATGLRTRIDHFAIRAACSYLAATDAAPRVAVKVSAQTLSHKGCGYLIDAAVCDAGIEPARLELEIEEQALHWRADIEPTLHHLHSVGVRIAIDRFGSGLASLSALAHLPISTVKIDESIAIRVTDDEDVANYARAIADVARHLRIGLVVVGGLTASEQTFFEGIGCNLFQPSAN